MLADIYEIASTVRGGAPPGPFDSTAAADPTTATRDTAVTDDGHSSADDEHGQRTDPETGSEVAGYVNPSTHAKQSRHWVSHLIGLTGKEGGAAPGAAELHGRAVLPPDRAGAPTDAGRLARMVLNDWRAPSVWDDDNAAGWKVNTPSPLAATPFYAPASVPDALPSPGGSGPALPATDPVPVNTWRTPPAPWDEYRYIGGPHDG